MPEETVTKQALLAKLRALKAAKDTIEEVEKTDHNRFLIDEECNVIESYRSMHCMGCWRPVEATNESGLCSICELKKIEAGEQEAIAKQGGEPVSL